MITIKVDATKALAKFSPAGIPEAVRNNLRKIIPDLTKQLGALVNANLDAGLKSRNRLLVKQELVENPTQITGRVTTIATSEPKLLPQWLEDGTKAHAIVAVNAQALSFMMGGKRVFFKSVWHPGFAGIQYSAKALAAMKGELTTGITKAVKEGVGKA